MKLLACMEWCVNSINRLNHFDRRTVGFEQLSYIGVLDKSSNVRLGVEFMAQQNRGEGGIVGV